MKKNTTKYYEYNNGEHVTTYQVDTKATVTESKFKIFGVKPKIEIERTFKILNQTSGPRMFDYQPRELTNSMTGDKYSYREIDEKEVVKNGNPVEVLKQTFRNK